MLNLTSAWEKSDDDADNIDWTRRAWSDMRRYSTGGTYINFLTEDTDTERTRAAIGKEFDRLAQVKAKWDPENIFRTNWNIKPAS
jgi:hypothetical protein